jgi:hypothetical protein
MQRVQVQVTDEQAAHLARRAAAKGTTVAGTIREAIDAQLAADEKQWRIEVALVALRKPAFHSDVPDLAENHDKYLAQAIEERLGPR